MNPYFGILLEIYFKDLGLTYFENDSKDPASKHSYPFHYSNSGDRVFVSFISNDENLKEVIEKGAEKVIKLLPYTPRSVLILRGDGNAIVEVTSLGTSDYNTSIATMSNGNLLDKKSIDYCVNNLDELAKLDSRIRICSLFFNESCKPQYFDEDNLYIINENIKNNFDYPLFDIVIQRLQEVNTEVKQKQLLSRRYVTESHNKKKEKLTLFQFPLDFIHPSLIRYQESLNCIVKWLDKSMQIKVFDVVGSRLLMRTNDVERLKLQIHNESEAMKEQLNLNYVAIQVPMKIFIKEHHTWHYGKKYRAIVTTKEESSDVEHLIENSNDNDNDSVTSFIENESPSKVLCCYYSSENPEDPILAKCPLSVFFKDGSYYISKACRGCLIDNQRFHLGYVFVKGKAGQKKVEGKMVRPDGIPAVKSAITKEGTESWPVIPLGLLVYVLINDEDEELSAYLSAWLYSIEEFTIRVMMQTRFLWCSHHPHVIYDTVKLGQRRFHCKECDVELESLQLDEEEAERRREEIRQRGIQDEIFRRVENRIRKLVDDQLKSQKVKRRADEEERFRREIEGKVRFENE
ncbi:hypothetical protein M9Y10_000386 [Tritrichomonas musculus]|uniref:Uncharacterized protein n=1 Tax=Tritrichomonas musculus TaxID=1915356 RepID=A0ABR2L433_9EUKA